MPQEELTRRQEIMATLDNLDRHKVRVEAALRDEHVRKDERMITIAAAEAVALIEVAKALTKARC